MPHPDPIQVLRAARTLISQPTRWAHLCDALDADGYPTDFLDPTATRWSDLGAIRHAAYNLAGPHPAPTPTWSAIEQAEDRLGAAYELLDARLGPAPDPADERNAYLSALYAFELALHQPDSPTRSSTNSTLCAAPG